MGTCYYLLREDTRTVFDLDKAYGLASRWRDRDQRRNRYRDSLPSRVDVSDELALRADIASETRWCGPGQAAALARRIVAIADGQRLLVVPDDRDDLLESYLRRDGHMRVVDSILPGDWDRMRAAGGLPLHVLLHGPE